MNITHFAVLYRNGPETASNTWYILTMDRVLPPEELQRRGESSFSLEKRYDGLTIETVLKVSRKVSSYRGPPTPLLDSIDEVLKPR
ncbi:MAG: hypothetical protein ABIH37_03520 [archaeon]